MGWRERAACRGMDPDLFLLDKSESGDVPRAKAVCRSCPVREECLDLSLTPVYVGDNVVKTVGVWGGMSEKQRRQVAKARKVPA